MLDPKKLTFIDSHFSDLMLVTKTFNSLPSSKKVNLSPINQPPSVQSISSTSIDENSFFDDVESNNTNIASNSDLEKFYRPTELVLPLMTPRDGPISAIDPAISGVYVEDKNSVISESNQEDIIQVKKKSKCYR